MKKALLLIVTLAGFLHTSVYVNSWLLMTLITEPVLNLDIDNSGPAH